VRNVNVFIVLCAIVLTCVFVYVHAVVIQPFGCNIINKVELRRH